MRVKVNDVWYDGEKEFIMVELTDYDRKNIEDMPKNNHKYAQFPEGTIIDNHLAKFMEVPLKILKGQPKGNIKGED